jgi:hypothetical protein
MKTISWTTPKGTEISLTLSTEKQINCDGDKSMVPDWDLIATAGTTYFHRPIIKPHPAAGICLNDGNKWAPIAANVLDEVKALVAEFHAERNRRIQASIKADREYAAHYNRIRRAMAE